MEEKTLEQSALEQPALPSLDAPQRPQWTRRSRRHRPGRERITYVDAVKGIAIVLVTVITDYIVCGTLTTIVSVPVYIGLTVSWLAAAILCIATGVILIKHRENYPRMLNGTELGLRSAIKGENKIP